MPFGRLFSGEGSLAGKEIDIPGRVLSVPQESKGKSLWRLRSPRLAGDLLRQPPPQTVQL